MFYELVRLIMDCRLLRRLQPPPIYQLHEHQPQIYCDDANVTLETEQLERER